MRQSKRNNSRFSRFVYYKYSGPIVFVPLIILAVGVFLYMDYNNEFFSAWSCDTIGSYLLDIDVPEEFPKHNDLTEDQHLKLHKIYQECVDTERFSAPISHDGM